MRLETNLLNLLEPMNNLQKWVVICRGGAVAGYLWALWFITQNAPWTVTQKGSGFGRMISSPLWGTPYEAATLATSVLLMRLGIATAIFGTVLIFLYWINGAASKK